ncbi:MAG: hypothetical protein Q7J98_05520, partial [Kiritimatiellia bacterium]|nr:hypothetical protein [Kiritimatiellia bacterium]
DLEIGDRTNKFTQTFASGTNPPTYGDSPWRICQENLDERYKVLNALECMRFYDKLNVYAAETKAIGGGADYADSVAQFLAASWTDGGVHGICAFMDSIEGAGSWLQWRTRGKFKILGGYTTNVTAQKIEAYAYLSVFEGWKFYDSDAILPGVASNTYTRVEMVQNPVLSAFPYSGTNFYGNSEVPIPDASPTIAGGWFLGKESLGLNQVFIAFNFQYCTDE